ncbi:MAG: glycoside hydrolase family 43 protein [Asticcacaulis sp.]
MRTLLKTGLALTAFCLSGCAGFYGGVDKAVAAEARFERFGYNGQSQESAQVNPSASQFINPIVAGYYPDPSVTRVGEDYYLINSTFAHFPGIPVFHSKDLVNWTQIGNAIDRPSQLNFSNIGVSRGVFAPDIFHQDGTFYIVNTCVDCGGNFIITAKDPAGPWSDPVWFEFDGIDPSIFLDTDGQAYMLNNGPPIGEPLYDGHRAIWIQAFDPKTLKLSGERTLIVNGGVDISTKPSWIEGPHLIKKDGYYYLIAAEGGTGDQHSQVVFRSDNVRGPFVPHTGNPILSQRTLDPNRSHPVTSAGHAKFIQTQNGDWWATFLATRPYGPDLYNIGRETFLLPVTWENGWPRILEDGKRIAFVVDKPNLPAQPEATPITGDFSYSDEFSEAALSPAWIGVRTPFEPFHNLKNGALILKPTADAIGDTKGAPAFIGRRQQHHVATITTTLTYAPETAADRAGLVALQSDEAYLFFGLTRLDNQTVVALYQRENASDPATGKLIASAPFDGNTVNLELRFNGAQLEALYGADGTMRPLVTSGDATFLSTRKAGGFVGTVIGPYVHKTR